MGDLRMARVSYGAGLVAEMTLGLQRFHAVRPSGVMPMSAPTRSMRGRGPGGGLPALLVLRVGLTSLV
jgi:hypothetical protein